MQGQLQLTAAATAGKAMKVQQKVMLCLGTWWLEALLILLGSKHR